MKVGLLWYLMLLFNQRNLALVLISSDACTIILLGSQLERKKKKQQNIGNTHVFQDAK